MKLKLLYTLGLVLCASTFGLSNECSQHEHSRAAADSAPRMTVPVRKEEETKTQPVKQPLSSYPIIRLLYI